MKNINLIRVNDEIRWMGGAKRDQLMSGVVVERVRAKTRPKYTGRSVEGKSTKREVSFIARHNKNLYWVSCDQMASLKIKKVTPSPRQNKPLQTTANPKSRTTQTKKAKNNLVITTKKQSNKREKVSLRSGPNIFRTPSSPFVPTPGTPMPPPFRQSFSCLDKHLLKK